MPHALVSAGTGEMRKRYGFIHVDKHDDGTGTYERRRKDSFFAYQKIIQSNGAEGLERACDSSPRLSILAIWHYNHHRDAHNVALNQEEKTYGSV